MLRPVRALGGPGQVDHHVVTQVIEPELVVGSVSDIRPVGLPPSDRSEVAQAGVIQIGVRVEQVGGVVLQHAHAEAQRVVYGPHPLGVALGQVVVHGDQMGTVALQRIEVEGQRSHQRLPLTGLHLRDLALMKDDTAQYLHVEVAQADAPL